MRTFWLRLDGMLRRWIDVLASAGGLVLISLLLVGVALAVRWQDGGPIFYRATRVGKDGRLFRLYKFRTMVLNADRLGPAVTTSGDPRITPVGRWLRRTKLDELPQLFNVLVGDMSLVGPRPEDPRYVALYNPEQREVLRVRPGITSAASFAYRREEQMLVGADWETVYREQVMPAKLALDRDYLARRTVFSDVWLMVQTVLFLGR